MKRRGYIEQCDYELTCNGVFNLSIFVGNFPWIDHLLAFFMKPDPAFTTLYSTCLTLVKTRRKEGRVKVMHSKPSNIVTILLLHVLIVVNSLLK